VHKVNYFVNNKGLDAMVTRLRNTDNLINIPTLKLHIAAWHKVIFAMVSKKLNQNKFNR